ncbi:CapA family protein [Anaerococcus degeneri]|uniref:CapA family protein n=1 Tax=Anaerococcus degeneri TaxID=361500 RepID=A0ABS7YVA2_9FIRM|nr:CapA family protein [Anaerococcus degeneri]MBP2015916.1 poly-gamma-glutamate synthesis protein (capsule biosynthesis protein) [Anaerococcus degeneri]MCA2095665.1 CapA family protein [Anaerococcus degeneri]
MKKKFFRIFLSLTMALGLVACSNNKDMEEISIKSVTDLITRIDNYQKHKEEEQRLAEEKEKAKNQEVSKKEVSKEDLEERARKEVAEEIKKKPEIKKVKLKAFGDIMAHMAQIQYAYNKGGGEYDFSDQFTYLKDFVKDSDISIGNYETTTNPDLPVAGFPRFNVPAAYLKNLKETGFDIVSTANNHSMDTELDGVFSTMEAAKEAGLDYVGSFKDKSDRILFKEVNGIKLAFLAYTYGCNGRENLIVPREEVENLGYLSDEDQIKKDISRAKAQGADFVIVYPHWGIEYQSMPNEAQITLGRKMIDWGADLVIGNHPHVVEPVEIYQSEDGRKGLIAYALGNFISNQNYENNKDIRTEHSLSLEIDLEKDLTSGNKKIANVKLHPIWVGTYYNDYGILIKNHLTEDFLEGGKYYDLVNESQRARIKQAHDMTLEIANTGVE